jgi:hypothetical protein
MLNNMGAQDPLASMWNVFFKADSNGDIVETSFVDGLKALGDPITDVNVAAAL